MTHRRTVALLALTALTLTACGTGAAAPARDAGEVTVTSCGQRETFPAPAERLFVNDSNLISMVLAIGAADQVAGVSSMGDDAAALATAYGADVVDGLPVATEDYPTLENVLATAPDVMVAGWNYGYAEEKNLTPDGLRDRGIAPYVLTESCRQDDGESRGTVPPWDALRTDLTNLGAITGHEEEAAAAVADLDARLDALAAAPEPPDPPSVFLFDSGTTAPFTSGAFGGPEAVITAAGATNAFGDVQDTWVDVSWERVASAQPDAIAFVDYPGQTLEQKIEVLRANPATRDLEAVKEERFLNLPYAAWCSGPLNIDAAEQLRVSLEEWGLVPPSDVEPPIDLRP